MAEFPRTSEALLRPVGYPPKAVRHVEGCIGNILELVRDCGRAPAVWIVCKHGYFEPVGQQRHGAKTVVDEL